jgi:hypothetical protein
MQVGSVWTPNRSAGFGDDVIGNLGRTEEFSLERQDKKVRLEVGMAHSFLRSLSLVRCQWDAITDAKIERRKFDEWSIIASLWFGA